MTRLETGLYLPPTLLQQIEFKLSPSRKQPVPYVYCLKPRMLLMHPCSGYTAAGSNPSLNQSKFGKAKPLIQANTLAPNLPQRPALIGLRALCIAMLIPDWKAILMTIDPGIDRVSSDARVKLKRGCPGLFPDSPASIVESLV